MSFESTSTVTRLVRTPDKMPRTTALALFLRSSHSSYKGIARQTVAGVKSQLRYLAPSL